MVNNTFDKQGVAVIIPTLNRSEMLGNCVESLLKGELAPDEIIIIDQSDRPHPTLSKLSQAGNTCLRYIQTHPAGASRARNLGVAAARHPILAFCDDDQFVSPAWLETIVAELIEAGPRSVVIGQVLAAPVATSPGGIATSLNADTRPAVYQGRVKLRGGTGNMAVYRAAFEEVGSFDERLGPGTHFPAGEDHDWLFRLLEAGYRIVYNPNVIMYHLAWRNSGQFFKLRWNYGFGQGAYHAKHLSLKDPYIMKRLIREIAFNFYNAACLLRRQPRRASGNFISGLGMLVGAFRWLMAARRARK